MEREGKVLGVKLKRGVFVGKRGGNSTPCPTWRYGLAQTDGSLVQDYTFPSNSTSLSVRKLGANLWELQPHLTSLKMSKAPLHTPLEQPADDLRRHVAALRKQHNNQSVEENDDVILCESPASCSSSMEMAPYRPAVLPDKMDIKGRSGKSSYTLKTSTELLMVLNRIWNLEEQHASHVLLVKALKSELDHSKIQIKELQQEKKMNRQEINELMNRIADEEVVRALRDELEDERKLRKHSENLQRKLVREVSEVKSSFCSTLIEVERERKARSMLEDLCDEFAKEVKEYEKEVRALKCKSRSDQIFGEQSDKLILHISEAWLDERMQMKSVHDNNSDLADNKKTILGRLGFEIEEFLKAKQSGNCRSNVEIPSKEKKVAKADDEDPVEVKDVKDVEKTKGVQVRPQKRSKQLHIRSSLLNSLIRNQLSRGRKQHETEEKRKEQHSFDPSTFSGPDSLVEKWTSEKTCPEPEPSAKLLPQSSKENTLKAKLLEARLESQQHHLRRASEGS